MISALSLFFLLLCGKLLKVHTATFCTEVDRCHVLVKSFCLQSYNLILLGYNFINGRRSIYVLPITGPIVIHLLCTLNYLNMIITSDRDLQVDMFVGSTKVHLVSIFLSKSKCFLFLMLS